MAKAFRRRCLKTKRWLVKRGFAYANIILILVVIGVVWSGHNQATKSTKNLFSEIVSENQAEAPIDSVSAADIAASVAKVASLPETVTVINQADSYNAQVSAATTNEAIVAKPQLVAGGSKSRKDITKYITVAGDTVTSLANKYGITSDSIRWSNGINGDQLPVGKELLIPPRSGIVYMVKSSDTVDSIVSRFMANKDQLVTFNDIEISGLPVGEYILIPDGVQPSAPGRSAVDSSAIYNFSPSYGYNGYTYGYCTWYVANRVRVPTNWGNANTWAYYARLSGWTVSSKPIPGAIAQSPNMSYWGHVAYVEEVSPDGTMMKYSDMNALAGWGRVGYSDWVPISTYQNYIYH